ncbi:MAG: monofunctional biosynthetic peptidoglycan transglycosylase [Gammaproteobacteria bacterium]
MTKATKSGNKKSKLRRFISWTFYTALALLLFTFATVITLRWVEPPVTAFMMLHNPNSLEDTRFEWRDKEHLGDAFALAVMAAEDQNFPNHRGLDVDAIAKALEEHEESGRLRGASGISQQLAKNLFLWPKRSFVRKGLEAYLAVVMELMLPKDRILELYVNVVELGPGLYGVPAASKHYFGTSPSGLTAEQAALLAAVLPNPRRLNAATPSDYVRERQRWIAEQAERLQRGGWLEAIKW